MQPPNDCAMATEPPCLLGTSTSPMHRSRRRVCDGRNASVHKRSGNRNNNTNTLILLMSSTLVSLHVVGVCSSVFVRMYAFCPAYWVRWGGPRVETPTCFILTYYSSYCYYHVTIINTIIYYYFCTLSKSYRGCIVWIVYAYGIQGRHPSPRCSPLDCYRGYPSVKSLCSSTISILNMSRLFAGGFEKPAVLTYSKTAFWCCHIYRRGLEHLSTTCHGVLLFILWYHCCCCLDRKNRNIDRLGTSVNWL